jgi:hypothetical protein
MSGMGWRGGKRRVVVVAGAASVVLGFLCALVVVPLLWDTTWTAATAVAMAAVPLLVVGGFVLLWEGLITWPDDGSPYPLRRRAKAAVVVLATAAVYLPVLLLIRALLASHLPRTWWGHEVAYWVALVVAFYLARGVWRRLRTGHWSQGPSAS